MFKVKIEEELEHFSFERCCSLLHKMKGSRHAGTVILVCVLNNYGWANTAGIVGISLWTTLAPFGSVLHWKLVLSGVNDFFLVVL